MTALTVRCTPRRHALLWCVWADGSLKAIAKQGPGRYSGEVANFDDEVVDLAEVRGHPVVHPGTCRCGQFAALPVQDLINAIAAGEVVLEIRPR